jgi:hypothetical protein
MVTCEGLARDRMKAGSLHHAHPGSQSQQCSPACKASGTLE